MIIRSSENKFTEHGILELVEGAWKAHPLLMPRVTIAVKNVELVLTPFEEFGVQWDQYPTLSLLLPIRIESTSENITAIITHELTHIIDRHDSEFVGKLSPLEITYEIESLHVERLKSEKRAFHTFWNAYINGRLKRREIFVDTFENSLREKFGDIRIRKGLTDERERRALQHVWETEPLTFQELVSYAKEYPYWRPLH
jgi:hypothetical protein